jgi:hypothetical protein
VHLCGGKQEVVVDVPVYAIYRIEQSITIDDVAPVFCEPENKYIINPCLTRTGTKKPHCSNLCLNADPGA